MSFLFRSSARSLTRLPTISRMSSTLTPVFGKNAAPPAAPYSPGMKVGNLLYVSGQVHYTAEGKKIEGSIADKTKQVFHNIEAILAAGNSSLDKIVKVNIFLTDMGNFKELNEIYGTYFTTHKPARSCVAVKELPLGCDVEIEVVAATND
ncbi:putative isoleucine biosynthesis protein [Saccharomycopsis crataegensis]|uniref:Isoleucine biosynthesis protein n=1 Tax=Saccharomycopsis crataegensis TaxID=43959 RepID=A0AAV5QW21_9ASCO|nr:putative isoleucine biosynthesis protein [Saccharomycopsis crataegensis]